MIELRRSDGAPVLQIGHRGAAHLEPENTIRSLRAAVEQGVDLVEFDVLDLPLGPLVLAHSDHLDEVTHGRATGSVRALTLAELHELAPELPTLADALAYFADEAPGVGLHVDLKLETRLDELASELRRFGLERRTVVSSYHLPSLRAVARAAPNVRIGFTDPEDRFGVSRRPRLQPLVGAALTAARAVTARRLPGMIRRADATALMLQHKLVTPGAVERAHAAGAAVLAWTVDTREDLERVVAADVDGVITNDPRLFSP